MIANHLYAMEIFGRKLFKLFGICEWATSTQRERQKAALNLMPVKDSRICTVAKILNPESYKAA